MKEKTMKGTHEFFRLERKRKKIEGRQNELVKAGAVTIDKLMLYCKS